MGKVKSLNLKPETRVDNYRVLGTIGRGWEGEVFEVEEVPSEARRAMKISTTEANLLPFDRKTIRLRLHPQSLFGS
jgi:hypothetical protein